MKENYDIAIIGAGPSGAACAICLGGSGLKVALIDKALFPRDKVCGDALTQDVYNQLGIISPALQNRFLEFTEKTNVKAIDVFTANGRKIRIPFNSANASDSIYTCTRAHFDNLLFEEAQNLSTIDCLEEVNIRSFSRRENKIKAHTDKGDFCASLIIGADGVNSRVARHLAKPHPEQHMAVGLRQYFGGVDPLDETNPLELYFLKDVVPAYIYIFPLPGDRANVGTGMLVNELKTKPDNLQDIFDKMCRMEPIASRLKNATPEGPILGAKLPFAVEKRPISGNNFMLIGDAAGLVNPLTGEGIGHGLRSARIAAKHAEKVLLQGDLSAANLASYDLEVYRRIWPELKWSARFRTICKYPFVLNSLSTTGLGQVFAKGLVKCIF